MDGPARSSTLGSRGYPDVFSALADPTRRSILDYLRTGPRNAGEIGAKLPHLTQPGVSRHLRVLRESGLVRVTARAQQRVYTMAPDRFSDLAAWVLQYVGAEKGRLERLATLVEDSPKRRKK